MNFQKVLICFMVAISLSACAPGSDKKELPAVDTEAPVTTQPEVVYPEIDEKDITVECKTDIAEVLRKHTVFLNKLNDKLDKVKGEKDDMLIDEGTLAIQKCYEIIDQLGFSGACYTLNNVAEKKKLFFDQNRVDQNCKKAEKYLGKFNMLPPRETQPPVVQPTPPPTKPPVVVKPPAKPPVVVNPPVTGTSRQCSKEEFSKLSKVLSSVDSASKKIDSLGGSANWKYNAAIVDAAKMATSSCEALIAYHDGQPCERTIEKVLKQYNGVSLRQRCEKARTYFYEFTQNKKDLDFANAELYLDISSFPQKTFEADYINDVQGCRVQNKSGRSIDYSGGGLVRIKDSRGFEEKMMVLESTEGLVIACYGLNIGEAFSKREVVRVLKEEGTDMPLIYKLK